MLPELNIAPLILAFLIGSIPTGYLLNKYFGHGDIRKVGSGNIGATNVLRHSGKSLGLITLLLDFSKGFIPIIYYVYFDTGIHLFAQTYTMMIGTAAILGHMYSPWLSLKGGKGVATTLGVILGILGPLGQIKIFLLVLLVWILIVFLTKYVALGSVFSLVFLVFYSYFFFNNYFMFFFLITLLIAYKHKDNYERIKNNKEHKITF